MLLLDVLIAMVLCMYLDKIKPDKHKSDKASSSLPGRESRWEAGCECCMHWQNLFHLNGIMTPSTGKQKQLLATEASFFATVDLKPSYLESYIAKHASLKTFVERPMSQFMPPRNRRSLKQAEQDRRVELLGVEPRAFGLPCRLVLCY